jgi:aminoglycoside/choline kinase family phosphotransferase
VTERDEVIRAFLTRAGWSDAAREPLPADASFRRYVRLRTDERTAMLMDAPPPREDVRPYLIVARRLVSLGYSAPRVFAEDVAHGLLLIEDFGDATYTRELAAGADERRLYEVAVDVLIDLHHQTPAWDPEIPRYDDARLLAEAALLVDWYVPAITGRKTPPALREGFLALWQSLLPAARGVPETLVLRDYHVDNLMRLPGRTGIAGCGLLDFQDAVIGPVTYDLVSLLEDARRDVAPSLWEAMVKRYRQAFPALDEQAFAASYVILGAQRNAKIIGIFTRLCRRDGKPRYLAHIPRLWRLLESDLRHPSLSAMREWFDRHIPPSQRAVP